MPTPPSRSLLVTDFHFHISSPGLLCGDVWGNLHKIRACRNELELESKHDLVDGHLAQARLSPEGRSLLHGLRNPDTEVLL
jgi:hypothetical protein